MKQLTFTKDFIRKNAGCYTDGSKGLSIVNKLDFMSEKGDAIPYTWILESSIPTTDKYWFFCKKVFTKEQNQRLSIGIAAIVLELFEKKYPNDDRPRKAIQAARQYLDGEITIDQLREARSAAAAAAAAHAAAYAAYADAAAHAAAYAAYAAADAHAAAYAAYAAADAAAAAYAAYAAADAAAAAYADADLKEALLQYLINFCDRNL